MDAGYGVDTDPRTSITALGLSYVAGIQSHTTVWGTWQGRVRQRGGPTSGEIVTQIQLGCSRMDSAVRVRYAQPGSPSPTR